jgi:hypothetical protein
MLRATLGEQENVTVLITDTAEVGVYECTLCVLRDNWRVFSHGTLLLKVTMDGKDAIMVGRAAKQLIHRETGRPAEGFIGSLLATVTAAEWAQLHSQDNLQKVVSRWFHQEYDVPADMDLTLVTVVGSTANDGLTAALLGVPTQLSREAAYQGLSICIAEEVLEALVLRGNVGWEIVEGEPNGESDNFLSSMGTPPGVAFLVSAHGYRFQRRTARTAQR